MVNPKKYVSRFSSASAWRRIRRKTQNMSRSDSRSRDLRTTKQECDKPKDGTFQLDEIVNVVEQ
jgi:hypothetical protein